MSKTFTVVLTVTVSDNWVQDGFDLTEQSRKKQLADAVGDMLPHSLAHELFVKVDACEGRPSKPEKIGDGRMVFEGKTYIDETSKRVIPSDVFLALGNDKDFLTLLENTINFKDKTPSISASKATLRDLRSITEIREAVKACLELMQKRRLIYPLADVTEEDGLLNLLHERINKRPDGSLRELNSSAEIWKAARACYALAKEKILLASTGAELPTLTELELNKFLEDNFRSIIRNSTMDTSDMREILRAFQKQLAVPVAAEQG